MSELRKHWEAIHRARGERERSWFEEAPETSLEFITDLSLAATAPILDVGGGASRLVDALLDRGFVDISVLDISPCALEEARSRLGERGGRVRWIERDITEVKLPATFALWHDRAAFHFLTSGPARHRYVEQLRAAVRPGGHVLLATFAEDGPGTCSGLPVARYQPEGLSHELGAGFELRQSRMVSHRTPRGTAQSFLYALFRRD